MRKLQSWSVVRVLTPRRKMLLLAALLAALAVVLEAGYHHDGSMPGSLNNISKNDPGLQKVILDAAYSFNNQSNDAFLFKASAIQRAQQQIIKGIRYIVDLEISRTVCHKQDNSNNLSDCDFQPEGPLQQTFQCHLEVWLIPWKDQSRVLKLLCET
ncbi:cystatin-F [Austrofundulus limnaeus]|uniref:Cystatin-F n=1 Tax=Austrofundulus limnaeus TaxID=52670 RepID=A0A2I4BIC4_AUSLI|nr:PREDICTED: cystatin-F-like [Austrofundulus limnaeus]